jgi:hypothetical protein
MQQELQLDREFVSKCHDGDISGVIDLLQKINVIPYMALTKACSQDHENIVKYLLCSNKLPGGFIRNYWEFHYIPNKELKLKYFKIFFDHWMGSIDKDCLSSERLGHLLYARPLYLLSDIHHKELNILFQHPKFLPFTYNESSEFRHGLLWHCCMENLTELVESLLKNPNVSYDILFVSDLIIRYMISHPGEYSKSIEMVISSTKMHFSNHNHVNMHLIRIVTRYSLYVKRTNNKTVTKDRHVMKEYIFRFDHLYPNSNNDYETKLLYDNEVYNIICMWFLCHEQGIQDLNLLIWSFTSNLSPRIINKTNQVIEGLYKKNPTNRQKTNYTFSIFRQFGC